MSEKQIVTAGTISHRRIGEALGIRMMRLQYRLGISHYDAKYCFF